MMEFIGSAYSVLAVLMLAGLALILIAVVTLILLALMASSTSPEPEVGLRARRDGLTAGVAGVPGPRARPAQARRDGRAMPRHWEGRVIIIRRQGHPGVP